ncbi:MAG: N-(5'-phosphoribosyl)anthranilate isomerase [Chthoniobacterales bacterium]
MHDFRNGVVVKICGITNLADAEAAAGCGADILGLNFSPLSKRCVTPAIAAAIVSRVSKRFERIRFAGIFVDQDRSLVEKLGSQLGLDAVQLHGDESPEYVEALRVPAVIKAVRVQSRLPDPAAGAYRCDAILLDTWDSNTRGGTGETFPWSIAAEIRPRLNRLILAGGLTPENVGEAIRIVRPFGVDVCSGVEDSPGHKDAEKIRAFVEKVREAEQFLDSI